MPARQPSLPEWARKFRPPVGHAAVSLDSGESDRSAIIVGLVATLLVNALLLLAPGALLETDRSILPTPAENVELDLLPPEEPVEVALLAPDENAPPRYVETNPDTPDREPPPDTPNESNRDQRAANEMEPEGLSPDHSPAREGEDFPSQKIVPGTFEPPEPAAPPPQPESAPAPEVAPSSPPAPAPESPPAEESAVPAEEQDPLPGEVEDVGEAPEGVGTGEAPPTETPDPVTEPVSGEESEAVVVTPPAVVPVAPPSDARRAAPAPRPRVARSTPGPVQRQVLGVSQTGTIEVDARFSEYGEYIARLVDAVSQHWHALCATRSYSERAAHVVIRFTLSRDGRIHNLTTVESSARSSGEYLCRTAIELGQPYGVWTEEMVASLGEDEPIGLIFYYR